MRHYIYLIITFILLFCLGCGSAESIDANSSPMESSPNASVDPENSANVDVLDGSTANEEKIPSIDFEDEKTANTKTEDNTTNDTTNKDTINNDNINIEEIQYVGVQTEHIYEDYTDRETGNSLVTMNYHVISLEEGNETLTQAISKWMVKRQQDLEEEGLALMVKVKNQQKETNNPDLTASLWHEITLYRVDERMISFVDRQYTYSIDDWNNDYRCVNIDAESGKNLLLHDVLVDKEGFRDTVISYCVDVLEDTYINREVDETILAEIYQTITTKGNWCLDASGFVFVYEDDEMEYSNEGVLFVHIPYELVSKYMNPDYLWGNTYGIAALSYDQSSMIVMDGVKQEICVKQQYDEYDIEQPILNYGDTAITMSQHMRTSNMYLIRHEKWNYLMMTVDMASADYQTYFYPLQKDGVGQAFAMDGALDVANVSANSFDLSVRVDVFGTHQAYAEYFWMENGTVGAYRMDYEIKHTNYEWCELETVRELPVMKENKKVMLPVGSKLRIISTDKVSWAKFLLVDTMEEVTVEFSRGDSYMLMIEGISEYEYFKELPYAG